MLSTPSRNPRLLARIAFALSLRVRYAPSPTGHMHLGGLRTALYNYLLAKSQQGTFVVRIEDTDKNRQVPGATQHIFKMLEWLGISPDESILHGGGCGPYIQSQRLQVYKQIGNQLLSEGKAYPCFCSQQSTVSPYDRKCRSLKPSEVRARIGDGQPFAIRIKADLEQAPATFRDEVYGFLEFKPLDDFIIVRRNGWPTFHLANVVDDWQMKITHVVRGQQWLNNTNKHIYLYQVLKAPVPKFVHLPLLKNLSGKKLAKRDPSSSAQHLIDDGYEVEAVRSFLFGLGMSRVERNQESSQGKKQQEQDKEKEKDRKEPEVLKLLSLGEMVAKFKVQNISRVPVKLDRKHLDFLNRQALRKRWEKGQNTPQELFYFINAVRRMISVSESFSENYIAEMLSTVVERLNFIGDLSQFAYYFTEPDYRDQTGRKDFQKLYGPQSALSFEPEGFKVKRADPVLLQRNNIIIHNLRMVLEHVIPPSEYNQTSIAKHISEFLFQSPSLKNQEVFHLLRYAVSARKSGPNIIKACEVIGRDKVLQRIGRFSNL